MAIIKPQLPPKAGYVEVVDENGNHVYKKVQSESDTDSIWSELDAAYREGVDSI